jgi:uncharacterized protein DUF1259
VFAAITTSIVGTSLPSAVANDSTNAGRARPEASRIVCVAPSSRAEVVRGIVASVDKRNDTITIQQSPATAEELKVRDHLLFDIVRYGTKSKSPWRDGRWSEDDCLSRETIVEDQGEARTTGRKSKVEEINMRKTMWVTASIIAAILTTAATAQKIDWRVFTEPFVSSAHAQDIDWEKVDEVLGRKPAVGGDVHRYGFPRSDLSDAGQRGHKARARLGGWVAFKPAHGGVMVMGDLVLLPRSTLSWRR